MKALTLYQPWATLVAIGAKRIETRSWGTQYRGPLAIHAGLATKYVDMMSKYYVCDKEPFYSIIMDYYNDPGPNFPGGLPFPRGAIIAICKFEGCFKIEEGLLLKRQERLFGDYTPGRFRWMLSEVRKLEKPIFTKGAMGLWEWDLPDGCEWNEDVNK